MNITQVRRDLFYSRYKVFFSLFRVCNCIFEHHRALFSWVKLTRYIPPIENISQLPDSPGAIETGMRKQESLLAELHSEISSGVAVSKYEGILWTRFECKYLFQGRERSSCGSSRGL